MADKRVSIAFKNVKETKKINISVVQDDVDRLDVYLKDGSLAREGTPNMTAYFQRLLGADLDRLDRQRRVDQAVAEKPHMVEDPDNDADSDARWYRSMTTGEIA